MSFMGNMADLQRAASNAQSNIQKNLGEYFNRLDKQNDAIINQLNELSKAIVSVYELQAELAKKQGIKIPEPHTDMTIEEEE